MLLLKLDTCSTKNLKKFTTTETIILDGILKNLNLNLILLN